MEFLCEYDFDVHYIKGKGNVIVDDLSRRRHEISILSLGVDLRGHILEVFPSDTWYQEVRVEVESRCTLERRFSRYSLEFDGLLHHLGRIYVPVLGDLHTLVFLEAHCVPYSIHPSIKKMYANLR